MRPNTCPIKNQEEVEKGEEATMAVGISPQQAGEAASKQGEGKNVELQQQVTILPSTAQEIVESTGDQVGNRNLALTRRDSVDSCASCSLADVEICDKSNSEGGASSENGDAVTTTGKATQRIIAEVEYLFSDDHLAKGGFLLKHILRKPDGFVNLKLVAAMRKVKQISREFPVVLSALKDSSKLEINSKETKVRRVEPLSPFLKTLPLKSKEKKNNKEKETNSHDENQLPNISANIKSEFKAGNKENNENGSRIGTRRNNAANMDGNQNRHSSNVMPGGHLPANRYNSFRKGPGLPPTGQQHDADLFRNVCLTANCSSEKENQAPQMGRQRGGSLPIARYCASRNGASPNKTPKNLTGTFILESNGARPKSNSCCEVTSPKTMSLWLQRRKMSSVRLSDGDLIFSGVIRQPRGPDGTKGFACGYRAMIVEDKFQQALNSSVFA